MNQDWYFVIFLLIPVAFIAGWLISRNKHLENHFKSRKNLYPDYFRGLNYVLNEQPDKAIEIFIKMIEVDSETIETHLALGNLFRKRGEVDRAIRLHQNLIARPTLSNEYRAQAYLELGKDYLKLGILDRAESLFQELIEMDVLTSRAYEHLLEIYQQQRDWENAIFIARRLESLSDFDFSKTIAQFLCEMADDALREENDKRAKDLIKQALRLDSKCVRASIMEGDLLFKKQNYKGAIAAYKRVENQDMDYIGEILPLLEICYEKTGKEEHLKKYLLDLMTKNKEQNLMKILARMIAKDEGNDRAVAFLEENMKDNPTMNGVNQLLQYIIAGTLSVDKNELIPVKELFGKLLNSSAEYQCNNCGFEVLKMHWYCPGCKSWGSIKPILGIS